MRPARDVDVVAYDVAARVDSEHSGRDGAREIDLLELFAVVLKAVEADCRGVVDL